MSATGCVERIRRHPGRSQWTVGYQYYGGIKTWYNSVFPAGIPASSPVKIATSKPGWVLAADAVLWVQELANGGWSSRRGVDDAPSGFSNLQAHKRSGGLPAGGNQLFMDASARWEGKQMY